jgi:transcriptional regulator with XRE-family HTH domain
MAAHTADDRPDLRGEEPKVGATAPEQAINPLQRLIQERLRDRGWSYGEVARRGGLPRSTVYTLATTRNLVRPPRPATIDALAKGLDVPVSVVRTAAAESTGLHYYDEAPAGQPEPGDQERELLIASIDELSPDDRRHVAALVESLRKRDSAPHQPRLPRDFGWAIPAASLHRPARGHPELIGEFLIGILRQDQAGDPQDRPGILARRPQYADRVIGLVMGHDQSVVVG